MTELALMQESNGAMESTVPAPTSAPSNGSLAGLNMSALPTTSTTSALSADEIALYDRQIRLWGAQAQERIRSANILLISLRALGTEIAKNLTLAGVRSLTIVDDDLVTEEDLGTQYFLRDDDIGKPRAQSAIPRIQELNPRVAVRSGGSLNDLLQKDQTFYEPFQCAIACDHDINTLSTINTVARFSNTPFYAAGIHGFYGYIFADLFGHEYVVEREKSNVDTKAGFETITRTILSVTTKRENNGKTTEIVKKQEMYCPLILANSSPLPEDVLTNRRKLKAVPALLPCLRALFAFQRESGRLPGHTSQDLAHFTSLATQESRVLALPQETLRADFLRSFIQNISAEIVPTAAFVGGRLSEDVINVLGQREQPIQNFALFDGDNLDGRIYCLYSPPPELTMAVAAQMGDMNGMNGMDVMANGMDMGMQMGLGADMSMTNGIGFMPTNMGVDMMGGMPMNLPMGMPMGNGNIPAMQGVPMTTAVNGAAPAVSAVPTVPAAASAQAPTMADSATGNGEAQSSTTEAQAATTEAAAEQ